MDTSKTRINILGEDFIIKADKSQKYIEKVIDLLKVKINKIQKMTQNQSSLRIALLTGILLAEDITDLREESINSFSKHDESTKIDAITSKLLDDLDSII